MRFKADNLLRMLLIQSYMKGNNRNYKIKYMYRNLVLKIYYKQHFYIK